MVGGMAQEFVERPGDEYSVSGAIHTDAGDFVGVIPVKE
jgi:hypothetical protein